ncbi:hypothetical protein COU12_01720 [Candidatus Jorgensenbacteria bacterium CG10_big_fil_rev_8_21_14_0_10_54_38]|uniref:Type 4 fimbrial biogenesis protein PilX N-terminal domain-containing protein n=2 Tax=Candidatus Joergenseniibacteriota TaxID=1752739 RepID=A0A2M6WG09_9BACT|nr:MAG: hypothetical protein COX26_00405 [Candidatus Jorgensenbacteria bacterium CG23_combo_of_CG06-09_8_20_14_all_54_14]PIT91697.1 MAG: hypothetical protein COU12_01720 [Candidatus Jorgensenbacteria bacterium CG10_big_fil_rev_8_21_14_0_10_54_38]
MATLNKQITTDKTDLYKSVAIRKNPRGEAGFIALISMLIIGALVLVVSVGVSLRSLGEADVSSGKEMAHRALALANLCAEAGLMKVISILNYAGGESIIVDGESCDILAVEGSGNSKTLKTESTVSGYTRKLKVSISQISPAVTVSGWEEVADF